MYSFRWWYWKVWIITNEKGLWTPYQEPSAINSGNTLVYHRIILHIIHSLSNTATETTTIVASSANWTQTFGFLDHPSTYWAIEPTGIGGEFILFKCTKYLRDNLTLAIDDLHSITESSSETWKLFTTWRQLNAGYLVHLNRTNSPPTPLSR